MRRTSWRVVVLGLGLACASHVGAQAPPPAQDVPAAPALSAAQQCDVERLALQGQVVELRAKVVELQTLLDRQALERERARVEHTLPVVTGWRWDWGTLRMVPAKETP